MESIAVSVVRPHALSLIPGAQSQPSSGKLKLSVRRAGICGSGRHGLHRVNPFARYPRTIGRDFAGEVVAFDEGVSSPAIGAPVVADPVAACERGYPCRRSRPNACAHPDVIGFHRVGGFGSEAILPEKNAAEVSRGLPLDRRLVPEVAGWRESSALAPSAAITQSFGARDAHAAFDFVETHPDRLLEAQPAFDE
jgi:L-gulonate 5-dehydrogenase